MSSTATSDRIEKSIQLSFPRSRVWRAVANAQEFGLWFGVNLVGQFSPGATIRGQMTNPNYTHVTFEAIVDTITPETLFSFWWRPFAIDPSVDYSAEPRTLVTFTFVERDGGTLLSVVETGFDGIPAARRAQAFEMNEKGWGSQMMRIGKYLADQS
jgi:uncharacterized protein YndB with AHSA1/START domain